MKFNYYHETATGDYHVITNESPVGFKGTLFVGRGPALGSGLGLEGIAEQVYAINQLSKLTPATPPDEWRYALGYEKPEPVMDDEGEVLDLMPVPAVPASEPDEPDELVDPKFDQFWYGVGMLAAVIFYLAFCM